MAVLNIPVFTFILLSDICLSIKKGKIPLIQSGGLLYVPSASSILSNPGYLFCQFIGNFFTFIHKLQNHVPLLQQDLAVPHDVFRQASSLCHFCKLQNNNNKKNILWTRGAMVKIHSCCGQQVIQAAASSSIPIASQTPNIPCAHCKTVNPHWRSPFQILAL